MDVNCWHCEKQNLECYVEINLRKYWSGEYHIDECEVMCLKCATSPGLDMIAWEMVRND